MPADDTKTITLINDPFAPCSVHFRIPDTEQIDPKSGQKIPETNRVVSFWKGIPTPDVPRSLYEKLLSEDPEIAVQRIPTYDATGSVLGNVSRPRYMEGEPEQSKPM
jgi:hypothetical protein